MAFCIPILPILPITLFLKDMFILRFFLFFLPFQFALSPVAGIDLPLARFSAVIIFLVWFFRGIFRRTFRIPWDLQTAALLSFCFFLGLSVFFANETSWAWRKLFFLISFLPLYLVFIEKLTVSRYRGVILAQSFVLGAFFSAIVGCVQVGLQFFVSAETLFSWWTKNLLPFFLGDAFSSVVAEYPSLLANLSGETIMRASAFFPDPHMHAFFLGIAFPFAVFFAWNEKRALWRWAASIIFVADLLTFSRGAYLGLTFALLGLLVYFLSQQNTNLRKLFLGLGFLGVFLFLPNPVSERFWSSFSQEDTSVSIRMSLYQEAVTHIGEHFWTGVGLGNYPLIVKPSADRRDPIYVHNLWLDLAVEIGVIGTLFLLFFFLRTIILAYTQSEQRPKGFSLAIFCSLLIFFGHSMVETPLFSVQILPILLFVLALGNMSYEQK
ncbi:MAG: O-antigen ligase family protein [Candidatus Moranbacteria bacterium]|jgi:hypothetical protein|nr:O-antigen ligase family protein [Candidatus Moranbacteria bacterium]MBP9801300.1 O-antigen ligase family protein [Candidatus Moranbacteria bacterium]